MLTRRRHAHQLAAHRRRAPTDARRRRRRRRHRVVMSDDRFCVRSLLDASAHHTQRHQSVDSCASSSLVVDDDLTRTRALIRAHPLHPVLKASCTRPMLS